MKCFVAVTRLLKKRNQGLYTSYYFHFRGAYEGRIVKGILLEAQSALDLDCGEDYLLYLSFIDFYGTQIRAKLIKAKLLKDLSH